MSESYYLNEIYRTRQSIEKLEEEIYKWNQKLNDLREFFQHHRESVYQIQEHFQTRRARVSNIGINDKEVKIFAQYKEHIMGLLNGSENQRILSQKKDESQYITRKISEVENKIQSLERQKYQLEQRISDLNYLLRRERLKNE